MRDVFSSSQKQTRRLTVYQSARSLSEVLVDIIDCLGLSQPLRRAVSHVPSSSSRSHLFLISRHQWMSVFVLDAGGVDVPERHLKAS